MESTCYLEDASYLELGLALLTLHPQSLHGQGAECLFTNNHPTSFDGSFACRDIDNMVMHAPYHKIVRKGFARLLPIDRLSQEMGAQALSDAQILNRESSVVSHHLLSVVRCIGQLLLLKPGACLASNEHQVRIWLYCFQSPRTQGHRPCQKRTSSTGRPL